jgi:hypothetical protein
LLRVSISWIPSLFYVDRCRTGREWSPRCASGATRPGACGARLSRQCTSLSDGAPERSAGRERASSNSNAGAPIQPTSRRNRAAARPAPSAAMSAWFTGIVSRPQRSTNFAIKSIAY